MGMTVNRGLAELKLLDARIDSTINRGAFIASKKDSAKTVVANKSAEHFTEDALSAMQSVTDLMERRKRIKSAIVESNAKTLVEIGGKQMTVATAIERKESIKYEKQLLHMLTLQYNQAVAKMNIENEKVQLKLDDLLLTTFGNKDKTKIGEDDMKAIADPYLKQNQWVLVDPLEIEKRINALSLEIINFESEVDFKLTEINVITQIDVE